jgi:hypothetical protein
MLLELEEAIKQNLKIILFIKNGLYHQKFCDVADEVIEYRSDEELMYLLQHTQNQGVFYE